MSQNTRAWSTRAFLLGFLLLTSLCWCPWAYGTLGGRVLGIPTWAVVAYGVATALFVLEWIFLFFSGLAISDEKMASTIRQLEAAGEAKDAPAKEDS